MFKITEFYGFEVFANNDSNIININYKDETYHMNVLDGSLLENITGELKYLYIVLKDWYQDMKNLLINMYNSKTYNILPDWEE